MAIMKVFDGTKTHYIFRPEDIVEVYDTRKGVEFALPVLQGENGSRTLIGVVTEKNARDVKREIQEQADEPVAYLKLTDERIVENGRRYINAKYLVSAHPAKVFRQVDGKQATVDGTLVSLDHHDVHASGGQPGAYIDMIPFEVARQIRRIQKRLDQDEDLCCTTQAADEEETE